ncbi:MAG: nucleoside hydrolase [Clostridium argentinense]|uniref:Nucleoside hydrolase n=1 Tax=Clostridium faecium TaxID=2762223 RepID=A0ABR8YRJ8_9CLOT|nr:MULTISPECIES: nucleoside hydrolase [Clostridium]MBD8046877.1 nucleoside hydrolase [Clostridium faecium]MBS5824394.1 nucleoside hydrolase [Clostridium argentinense]MDU1349842.1 nucleoside hydrolase [Clostridium argentinense]
MREIVIHQTDIYHDHLDPDDHWDLACQYALNYLGKINLAGVLIDNVPKIRLNHGDPSIYAVNQLNYLTGKYIPVAIGTKNRSSMVKMNNYTTKNHEFAAVNMIKDILEASKEKVIIQIVGSCKDVSIAINLFPDIFEKKCKAIYLNAGTANPNSKTEYNVSLDSKAFSTVFNAKCPIYWLPSHENFHEPYNIERHGTFYKFKQGDVLPFLSEKIQKYFIYSLGKVNDMNWLTYLNKSINKEVLNKISFNYRNMWSTIGILHAAGQIVTTDGNIVDLDRAKGNELYSFKNIDAQCDNNGRVEWNFIEKDSKKYIISIENLDEYQSAMTNAIKELLINLP